MALADAADTHGAGDVVEGGGVFADMDFRVGGGDGEVAGAAFKLQVAFRFESAGGLVIDGLVGADGVVAIEEGDFAGEGPVVAVAALIEGFPADGVAFFRDGNGDCGGKQLEAGIVGNGGGGGLLGRLLRGRRRVIGRGASGGCRIIFER